MKSSHLDERGQARMVDISDKQKTARVARARAIVKMSPETATILSGGKLPKGDAIPLARAAGVMAAKQTPHLIPLCHPIALSSVQIDFDIQPDTGTILIIATASAADRTGVEMEAITAAAIAAITIYDMCKSVQKDIEITGIALMEKTGGKNGRYIREEN